LVLPGVHAGEAGLRSSRRIHLHASTVPGTTDKRKQKPPRGGGFFRKMLGIRSVASKLEAPLGELFANLIEARDAEVLAFHQILGRPTHKV